ncbi:MAG: hypothetical protein U1F65_07285 [Verrucomicrobiota bacterium]
MAEKRDVVRRTLGVFFLAAAVIMLVLGETALGGYLSSHPREFLLFWLVCFLFVGLALLTAVLDMMAVRRRLRGEQRELVENTLHQIEEAKIAKEQDVRKSS